MEIMNFYEFFNKYKRDPKKFPRYKFDEHKTAEYQKLLKLSKTFDFSLEELLYYVKNRKSVQTNLVFGGQFKYHAVFNKKMDVKDVEMYFDVRNKYEPDLSLSYDLTKNLYKVSPIEKLILSYFFRTPKKEGYIKLKMALKSKLIEIHGEYAKFKDGVFDELILAISDLIFNRGVNELCYGVHYYESYMQNFYNTHFMPINTDDMYKFTLLKRKQNFYKNLKKEDILEPYKHNLEISLLIELKREGYIK